MLKQKIALVVSTLFLLSTLALPGVVFAVTDSASGSGTVTISGTTDVWCDVFLAGACSPEVILLTTAAGANPVASSVEQQVYGQTSASNGFDDFDESGLIGVINLGSGAWSLAVDVTADFTTSGSETIALAGLAHMTSSNDSHWTTELAILANGTIDVTHEGAQVIMTQQDIGANTVDYEVFYNEFTGYTWVTGDVKAAANTATADCFDKDACVVTSTSAGPTILATVETDANGIFATGIGYKLDIPGGTPAETYTSAAITYTVTY